jgi:hypothetical protein
MNNGMVLLQPQEDGALLLKGPSSLYTSLLQVKFKEE